MGFDSRFDDIRDEDLKDKDRDIDREREDLLQSTKESFLSGSTAGEIFESLRDNELYKELKDIRDKTSIGIEVVVFDERDEDARDEDERNATVYAVTLGSAERLVEAGFGNADVIGMLRDFDVDIRDEDIERHDEERYAVAVNVGDERFEIGRF